MNYLVTLTPLNPFFFGGNKTFGSIAQQEEKKKNREKTNSYLVKSRQFPQQTALLGMIRKEMLIQKGLLTKHVNGEWIDNHKEEEIEAFLGDTNFIFNKEQKFGVLKSLGAVFLMRGDEKFIKKVAIDSFEYNNGLLEKKNPKDENDKYFTSKDNIYDNFVSVNGCKRLKSEAIFEEITQIGIKKFLAQEDKKNAYFKKTSYLLKHNFKFAFYLESDFKLQNSIVSLGAERSMFKLEVKKSSESLEYQDKNGYLTLLSDSYIDIDIKPYCDFAITSEISFRYLNNYFDKKTFKFNKSDKSYNFYEKGSIFINPKPQLIEALNKRHLQKIGYNQYSYTKGENR